MPSPQQCLGLSRCSAERKKALQLHFLQKLTKMLQNANKDLLDSTFNPTQCDMPAWIGGVLWGRRDTCICMAESLHCSPETTTTLLIGCNPIQNKKYEVRKKKKQLKMPQCELGPPLLNSHDTPGLHITKIQSHCLITI